VLEGLARTLAGPHPPAAVVVEVHAASLAAVDGGSGGGGAAALVARMADLGYTQAVHAGPACGARWAALTRRLRLPSSSSSSGDGRDDRPASASARKALGGGSGSGSGNATATSSTTTVHGLPRSALLPPTWCRLSPGGGDAADFQAAALRVAGGGRVPPAASLGAHAWPPRGIGASVSGVGGGETVVFVRPATTRQPAAAAAATQGGEGGA
jgi:hypothetical protein